MLLLSSSNALALTHKINYNGSCENSDSEAIRRLYLSTGTTIYCAVDCLSRGSRSSILCVCLLLREGTYVVL